MFWVIKGTRIRSTSIQSYWIEGMVDPIIHIVGKTKEYIFKGDCFGVAEIVIWLMDNILIYQGSYLSQEEYKFKDILYWARSLYGSRENDHLYLKNFDGEYCVICAQKQHHKYHRKPDKKEEK